MAAQQETKPVEDSVAKVDDDIAVGSDLEFQRAWWKFEKIAWFFLSLILLADLAGVFGRGPLANAEQRAPDSSMTVKYERVERFGTPSILTVQIGQAAIHDRKFQLWASEDLVKPLGNQRVVPQPLESVLENSGIRYTFPANDVPGAVEFVLTPASPGVAHLRLHVAGSSEVVLTIFTMP